jgi:hypothetical protein
MVSLTAVADIDLDEQKLKASDAAVDDHFGRTIAISGDTALIRADSDDDGTNSGSVYVFVRIDGLWVEQAKLTASNAATDVRFGSAVAISGDTALIGAMSSDDNGTNSGSVYVLVRIDGLWVEQAKLTASDATTYDNFGEGLAQSLHFRRSPREIASRQWSRVRAPRSPGRRIFACPFVSPRDLG